MARQPSNAPSRRDLMQFSLAAGGVAALASLSPRAARAEEKGPLKANTVILFQGDSITDAGRNRNAKNANNPGGLGDGYPYLIAAWLLTLKPDLNLQFLNRGVSGNKVPDLDKRWDEDCINLKPDVLSILIGVNDLWHKLNGNSTGTVADYEKGYAALLAKTKKALPDTKIVVCEPFVLKCGAVNDKWFPEFDERRAAAKKVMEGAGATWVPFQAVFDEAVKTTKPQYWGGDGVHPSIAGHGLMAKAWIEAVVG